ncbi:hypothetical protein M2283_000159 [Streptomyces pseudovenezuelae]|uniref:Uncharacterized protein n=1 Tax=Streptomyces pseudovenezuelae TaxID=67350 RepID=A0ABT6L981_9ACTN|nr:hypothetical protein [Streptomyces pseudovenezuelae]
MKVTSGSDSSDADRLRKMRATVQGEQDAASGGAEREADAGPDVADAAGLSAEPAPDDYMEPN